MTDLFKWLDDQELSLRKAYSKKISPEGAMEAEANLQFYAFHHEDRGNPTKHVILAIGANYSQQGREPTEIGACDELGKERENAKHALNHVTANWERWTENDWCSISKPPSGKVEEFIFIMTNLSPWFTKEPWTDMHQKQREALLKASRSEGHYNHVDDLLKQLRHSQYKVTVVGHGVSDAIREQLLNHLKKATTDSWFLYANLSRRFTPRAKTKEGKTIKFAAGGKSGSGAEKNR